MTDPLSSHEDGSDAPIFRAALRRKCLAERESLDPASHSALSRRIEAALESLLAELPEMAGPVVAFCSPMRHEFDARPLVARLISRGWRAAMPVVTARQAAMSYRPWTLDCAMTVDPFGIPIPRLDELVQPDIVLVPLVAFDADGFRLGYGGGFFDRTLAAQFPPPFSVGIGFELGRVPTIRPQAHDVRLSAIVTEAGVVYHDVRSRALANSSGNPAANPAANPTPSV